MQAFGINRTDFINRKHDSYLKDSPILGVEVAGIVVEADKDSTFRAGDRIMGLVNGGAYAEYVVVPEGFSMNIPDNLTFEEAAASLRYF